MRRPMCLLALVFAAVIYVTLLITGRDQKDPFESYNRQEAVLTGTVLSVEQRMSGDGTISRILYMEKAALQIPSGAEENLPPVRGRVICTLDEYEEGGLSEGTFSGGTLSKGALSEDILPGSVISLRGTIRTFAHATNHGEFDSSFYYRRVLNCNFRLTRARVTEYYGVRTSWRFMARRRLYAVRRQISARLDELFDAESAGVMKAMLLGERGFLPEELKDLYRMSGIVHILAISGLHISFIGMGLFRILRKGMYRLLLLYIRITDRRASILLMNLVPALISGAVIIAYGIMTDAGPSAVRAILMFLLHITSFLLQRTYDLPSAAGLCCILLLLENPFYILYSGFQFSFAAVFSIGLLLPLMPGKAGKAAAVPAAVLPVYLCSEGAFPVLSILVNLAVLPLMSLVLAGTAAAAVISCISLPLGRFAAGGVRCILLFFKAISGLSSKVPFGRITPGHPSAAGLFIYLLVLLVIVAAGERIPKMKRVLLLIAAVFILTVKTDRGLAVRMIDVGQGDGILITCGGHSFLIDGGSSSQNDVGRYQIGPLLAYYGVSKLDAAIVTHEDEDHMNGLLTLLEDETMTVRSVVLPDTDPDCRGANYRKIEETAEENGVPVVYLSRGDVIRSGKSGLLQRIFGEKELTLTCLHPAKGGFYEAANEYSLTILLQYGDFKMLLTGDLEGEGEEELIRYLKETGIGDIPVLKVAHHGSAGSTPEELLDLLRPRAALISCGRDNLYGHPHRELTDRLAGRQIPVYRTDRSGEIQILTDGERIRISTYAQMPHVLVK